MKPRTLSWSRFGRSLFALTAIAAAGVFAGCDGGTFTGTLNFDGENFDFNFNFPQIATDSSTQTQDVTGITTLRVRTKNGFIRVLVDASRDDALIRSFTFANASSNNAAEDLLSQITLKVEKTGDNSEILDVSVEFPDTGSSAHGNGDNHGPGQFGRDAVGASLKITLPAGLILDLESSNGSVSIEDNSGNAKARTTNGSILIDGNAGDIDLATDNGGVEARKVTGNALVRAINGNIIIRATPPDNGSIDAETINGGVSIAVPTSTKAALDLHTTNGHVETDFTGFTVTDENSTTKDVTATLNGGGGTIHGKTTNGGVDFEGL